jgi:uncharacterized protein GlcG (DUF336 family)
MSVSLKEASEITEAMMRYATETKPGAPMTFVVADEAGVLISLARMDGASRMQVHMVMNKVYTATMWGRDTKKLWEKYQDPEEVKRDIAWYGDSRYTPNPGGVLLKAEDGTVVGAVASSGRTAEEDEELPQVGAKVYQEILKRKP